ncbi:MAG: hypothetical protein KA716_32075 [Gloeotrichia echinulata DEX184]|jgi:hypothetical protein|nr:hypothetical protein [Gloeotrichia echinulata DEX184]
MNFDGYSLERLIYESIAGYCSLSISNLRFFPKILSLPGSDRELFNLLDIIPSRAVLFDPNADVPRYSRTYEAILKALPTHPNEARIIQKARGFYANAKYWLEEDVSNNLPKTPKYSPTLQKIREQITDGGAYEFLYDSSLHTTTESLLSPSFPRIILYEPYQRLNTIVSGNRFEVKIKFDKMVSAPIRAEEWLYPGALTYAHNNREHWVEDPELPTYSSIFGPDGILKFSNTQIIAVTGIQIELKSYGSYEQEMIDDLRSLDARTSIWPFYLTNVEGVKKTYLQDSDHSLTIKTSVDKSQILLLLMGVNPSTF